MALGLVIITAIPKLPVRKPLPLHVYANYFSYRARVDRRRLAVVTLARSSAWSEISHTPQRAADGNSPNRFRRNTPALATGRRGASAGRQRRSRVRRVDQALRGFSSSAARGNG